MKNRILKKFGIMALTMLYAVNLATGCGSKANTNISEKEVQEEEISDTDVIISDGDFDKDSEENEDNTTEDERGTAYELMYNSELSLSDGTIKYEFVKTTPEEEDIDEGYGVFSFKDDIISMNTENRISEWPDKGYVLDYGNDNFIIFYELAFASDWNSTVMIKHTKDGGFVDCGFTDGGIAEDSSIDAVNGVVVLNSRVDIFGTYGTQIPYMIKEDGLVSDTSYISFVNENEVEDGSFLDGFDAESKEYMSKMYDANGRNILCLKKDLEVILENGNKEVLKAGSVIYPIGFNPDEEIFYIETEGRKASFTYEFDEETGYGHCINGISENDMFEAMPYAG